MFKPIIEVVPSLTAIAEAAAERVVTAARQSIALHDAFTFGLSGGSTPKALFQLLASDAYKSRIDWTRTEIFFGDERTVPPDHKDSNFRMASEALLQHVPIPGDNIYRMHGELPPEEAAKQYGRMLKERFGDPMRDHPGIDLLLLGMGDDGHTASLFPGTAALGETHHRCVANHVPQLDTWRITLSAPFINLSNDVLILVSGAGKASRVAEVLEGDRDPDRLPIQLIQPDTGRLTWVMDADAAGMNE